MDISGVRRLRFQEGVIDMLYAIGQSGGSGETYLYWKGAMELHGSCTAVPMLIQVGDSFTLHQIDGLEWTISLSTSSLDILIGTHTVKIQRTFVSGRNYFLVFGYSEFTNLDNSILHIGIYNYSGYYNAYVKRGLAYLYNNSILDLSSESNPYPIGTTLQEVLLAHEYDELLYAYNTSTAWLLDTTYGDDAAASSYNMFKEDELFLNYKFPVEDSSKGSIANATITLTPNTFVYDGEAKTPNVTVTLNGVQLTEGVDYIKTYENNINPGTAAVLVAGQGDYAGSQRVYFTISSGIDTNDIANATITLSPSMYYYDGTAKTPNVTVKMGAVQLTEGTDYIKTYENNINEGLASVLVAGQGNYTGSKRAYFSIYAATNPYDNLEPSGPSDTTPTYDYSSDAVGLPTLPDISMADVGLVRIYNPTKAQLNSLAQYLWTDTTFVDTLINHFKQIFESPMNAIIALNLLPCPVPNSGAQELKVMYIPTGVQMNVATNQFVDVDCGKVTIETVYGSALDYAPYTKASIFLPYVGQVSLNVDEIMGKVLRVHYRVDIVTGGCVALIDVDGTVMYQFSGHCAISMPLSGADFSNLIGALIQSAKAAATIAGGGAAAIAGAAEGATRYSGSRKSTPSLSAEMGQKIAAMDSDVMDFAGLTAKNIGNTVGAVMGAKPDISRTGTFSGNTGYLGVRRPYVILERPRLCNPQEYGRFNGYPSMQTVQLNNARGFTQVQQIQLTGISATGPELDELQTLLKQGVIL